MNEAQQPRWSVIVRSYNRLAALGELVEALLAQDHPSFEIVIVEQSTLRPAEAVARLDALALDPRLRVLRHPPLGGTAARNTGARASRGELLAFIDDDDLPADRQWLRKLETGFADPRCLAVTGRQIVEGGKDPPYFDMARARENVMSYSWLKWQRCYAQTDRRAIVEGIHGTNAAIRRSALVRFGLWDTCCRIEDESSLCFRLLRGKRPDEYVLFDPEPAIVRRIDLPGGLGKREMSSLQFGARLFEYLHNIVGHYHRHRFVALYPAYVALLWYLVCEQILEGRGWRYAERPVRKAATLIGVSLGFPALWTWWLVTWLRSRLFTPAPERGPPLAA
jgi:glycosyltransferase involved in cell wall biosynthesis